MPPQTLKKGSKGLNLENWKVFSMGGKHMFTCGERKAEWYLNKKLAKLIGENEIQLTFKPKGYGFEEGEVFGLAGRVIQCVVTGEENDLQRHHIVPYCYRRWFPEEYKSKNHHDVVLVTYKIHEQYERQATIEKDQIAEDFGVKTLNEYNLEYTKILCEFSNERTKMLSRLHSIFKSYDIIPVDVIYDIFELVSKYSGINVEIIAKFNFIQLYKLYLLLKENFEKEFDKFKENKQVEFDHGYHVVKQLDTHEKIREFVIRWRKHFVNTMKPKYMPEGWRLNFRVKVEL
jgi:hypothetical protein